MRKQRPMKKLLLIASLLAGPALLFAQRSAHVRPERAHASRSGPPRLEGPDDPERPGPRRDRRPRPGRHHEAAVGRVDELLRRSHRQALQRAEARQQDHGQEPQPQVDHAAQPGVRSERHGAAGGAAAGPAAAGGGGGGRGGGGGGPNYPIVVGGLGNGDANTCGPARIGGGVLAVDGTLYAASPNNVFAVDARDGAVLWHNYWKSRGGTTTGTRGPGMLGNMIYFSQHDDWVVALDAKTGKEVWRHEVAPFDQQYFSSNAPMAIDDHLLVGTGNDLDAPGLPEVARSADGRGAVDLVCDAAEGGRSRPRDLGEPRRGASRQRCHVDSGRLRSGDQALHLRHRQPDAVVHDRSRRGRQPVHVIARRVERRHRQDGVVLPDVAARHARLGFDADASALRRDVQRPHAQDDHDGDAQRLLLRARPHERPASRHEQAGHRQQLGAGARPGTCRGAIRTRTRRSRGRSSTARC